VTPPGGGPTPDRLFVALDVPDGARALELARRLRPLGVRFKVGLELFCREGPPWVRALQREAGPVFLDLKLHDIPRTVAAAVGAVAELGVWGVTLHAAGGRSMMEAAREAAAGRVRLVAVTVLTSLDDDALREAGFGRPAGELAEDLARLAAASGADALVAAASDVGAIRRRLPGLPVIVPGIRPERSPAAGAAAPPGGGDGSVRDAAARADQRRVATPRAAVEAGADYLVVGRPVVGSPDPVAACRGILGEMGAGGPEG
jgi:orotidine-5'-phosphate decarboxylase